MEGQFEKGKGKSMKVISTVLLALMVAGCAVSRIGVVSPAAIDAEVRHTLKLYPAPSTYRILIVPDDAAVKAEHYRIYGKSTKALAFYSIREDLVVLPMDCHLDLLRVWRHEVGHAVAEAYFKMPLPRWLHQEIAWAAEGK